MKSIVLLTLLLSGCAGGMHGAPSMHAPAAPMVQTPIHAPPAAPRHNPLAPSVEIIAEYEHTGSGKLKVSLRAVTVGLEPPLHFHWMLGNGKQWDGPQPWPQSYEPGRYDVWLSVTDAHGRVKRSSVVIDAESMGCAI